MAIDEARTILVGDWVRFYSNGRMVIGVVQYVRARQAWEDGDRLLTDSGEVGMSSVLEVRRGD